ncbi:MAG: HAD family phosphatase [Clostridia bacterium]|nr:HAD family phosphatase [Clostridia bacterium]
MIKGKKLIIFDLDGTLIDSIGIWNEIDRKLIETITTIKIEEKLDLGKRRDEKLKEFSKCEDLYLEYCRFLKEEYHAKMSAQEIKKIRYEIANQYLKEVIDYKPKAEETLKYLKEKGFLLAIASTTNDHIIEIYQKENKNIIKKAKLQDFFTLIYSKGAVKEQKPSPEIHHKILEKLELKPEECLIIEDSLIGVESANNANIEVAVIYDKYSDGKRKEINQLSQYQFKNFEEMLLYMKSELGENRDRRTI